MPSRNTVRIDIPEAYYHVYNRGLNQQTIYHDNQDKYFFLSLLERYLSTDSTANKKGSIYKTFADKLELLCYCLMDNHFHLLVYQSEEGALKQLMQALANSYIRYYNDKYDRKGPLFESRYKSSQISNQGYLEHISRYIHLNPKSWKTHTFSSIHAYLGGNCPPWLTPAKILELFESPDQSTTETYLEFTQDYEDHKAMLDEIKQDLANK